MYLNTTYICSIKTNKMKKTTKHDQVKSHLKSKRQISSLEAIKLFSATRLSAIIYNLRRKECWDIVSVPMQIKDRNGNTCVYSLYKLNATKEESILQKKFEKSIIPSGDKLEKKSKK